MKNLARLVVLSVALALPGASAHATTPPPPGPQESLVELLPARARLAVVIRKNALKPLRDLFFSDAEMMRELTPYLERSLGVDVTRLEGIALFTMDATQNDPKVGILLRIPAGGEALKLRVAGDAGGTPLYQLDRDVVCARTRAGIAVGHESEVRALVAVDRGREPALPKDSGLGRLLGADANNVDLAVAIGPGSLPQAAQMGVNDAVLSFRHNGLLELVARGDASRLSGLKAMAQGAIQSGLQALQQEKDRATATSDPLKGAAAIVTYHQARRMAAELDPKLVGDTLTIRYQLPDLAALGQPALLTSLLGVGSAVAIPSFVKYQRRSKAIEARTNTRRIAAAVLAWASEPGHRPATLRSTDWAPAGRCCGQPGNKCAPDAKSFAGPTWKALDVAITEPGIYQYRILVEPKAKPARVVVEARGDQDCDGEYASFRQVVTWTPTGPSLGELESEHEDE